MAKKDFKKNTAELFISAAEEEPEQGHTSMLDMNSIPRGFRIVKENKSARMQLLVRPSTKDALRRKAAAQGFSMNDLINIILEDYIERAGK